MEKVESFKLDHTKVKAPYIRKCCELKGTNGDWATHKGNCKFCAERNKKQ